MRRWFVRLVLILVAIAVLGGAAVWLLAIFPRRVAHPALQLPQATLAIEHALIYVSPGDPPIEDGTVVMVNGRIAAVGKDVVVPSGATKLPCDHCVVMAGFWNAHVHFTERKWAGAEWKPAADLNAQLADMLTTRGFTTVVDVGSNLSDTLPLRRRIESGELAGPMIETAGAALYPPNGIPFYLRDTLPGWLIALMPTPNSPKAAVDDVRRNLKDGADLTKLFTGSYIARGKVLPMPLDIARAAVEETHHQGRLVFAHPSDLAGTRVAVESGVDVLAHAPDTTEGITDDLLGEMVRRKMGMVPTLKMFATTVTTKAAYLDPIYGEVRRFHQLGGQLIFGTDVGYMTDYTTADEFVALGKSGLTPMDVLAMLTTNPAARFGVTAEKGTVAEGKLADLTVLDADPAGVGGPNLGAFAQVRMTIRSGRVIYQR